MYPILLYDGLCGLCNGTVNFVLRRDRRGIFRFAALQSPFGQNVLQRHGVTPTELDTAYVVLNCGTPAEILLSRSDAVAFVGRELGGVWRFAAWAFRSIPRPLRDWGYSVVAHHRYRIFGQYESCPVPSAETKARFVDQGLSD